MTDYVKALSNLTTEQVASIVTPLVCAMVSTIKCDTDYERYDSLARLAGIVNSDGTGDVSRYFASVAYNQALEILAVSQQED